MASPKPPPPDLPPARLAEVEVFVAEDPAARRFFLFFDACRLRGVPPATSAHTVRALFVAGRPEKDPPG
jgi:hypothetical protein